MRLKQRVVLLEAECHYLEQVVKGQRVSIDRLNYGDKNWDPIQVRVETALRKVSKDLEQRIWLLEQKHKRDITLVTRAMESLKDIVDLRTLRD